MIESSESFGKYTLIERVAVGGMAEIFKAKTHGIDGFEKMLAIKRLHRRLCEDQDFAMMLVDEAKISVQLNHANIGQVFDLGYYDDQYFIVMEYIDGLDMHQMLRMLARRRQRIPLEVAVYVAAQACEALHYAHNKTDAQGRSLEIIHRDVSPQNVMVSRDGEVKLVDFGIAKARMRAQQTQAGIIKGKFYYMSPEQARGQRIDHRTDVYAVGILLYEMIAGKNPYEDVEDAELLQRVRQAEFAPLAQVAEIDGELAQIVEGALARNVEQRFQSALDLQRALLHYAHRRLRPFSRIELSEFVAALSEPVYSAGGERATFPAMRKQEYVLGGDSLIFDANPTFEQDYEDPDSTRVFERNGVVDEGPGRVPVATATAIIHGDEESAAAISAGANGFGVGKVLGGGRREKKRGRDKQRDPAAVVSDYRVSGSQRGRVLVFALIGVLVLAVVAGVVVVLTKDSGGGEVELSLEAVAMQSPPVELVKTVTLPVTSVPANAQVYLNGEFYGDTPIELSDLDVGTAYTLMLRRSGYGDVTMQLMAEMQMEALVVQMPAQQGVLKISSYPAGAMIKLNAEELGQAPVTAMELSRAEEHKVVAELAGFPPMEKVIQWKDTDDRIKEVQFEFEVSPAVAEEVAPVAAPRKAKRNTTRRASKPAARTKSTATKETSQQRGPLNLWD